MKEDGNVMVTDGRKETEPGPRKYVFSGREGRKKSKEIKEYIEEMK